MSTNALIAYQSRANKFICNTVNFDGQPNKLGVALLVDYNDAEGAEMLCKENQIQCIDTSGDVKLYPSKLNRSLRIVYTENNTIYDIDNIAEELLGPFNARYAYIYMQRIGWYVYDIKHRTAVLLKRYIGSAINKYMYTEEEI